MLFFKKSSNTINKNFGGLTNSVVRECQPSISDKASAIIDRQENIITSLEKHSKNDRTLRFYMYGY